jgi:hypothetical protein
LLVGADDRENNWIGEALAEHAAISMSPRARGLSVVNTDVMSVGTREKLYAQGGIFSITSRILVVDLLTNLLNPETITGVVVLHADKVVATSLEANRIPQSFLRCAGTFYYRICATYHHDEKSFSAPGSFMATVSGHGRSIVGRKEEGRSH